MESSELERLVVTQDGTHTLYNATLNQHYHSLQGSLQESQHIFIELGLKPLIAAKKEAGDRTPIRVFEMGFGTGLNSLLTWKYADELEQAIDYTGVEAYPVSATEAKALNYEQIIHFYGLNSLHEVTWSERHDLSDFFTFEKIHSTLESLDLTGTYDLIYYDAFAPETQPELWTEEIFKKLASHLVSKGSLVTYSSKGLVRRALKAAGFTIEKHPGPGRKREVVKAIL